MDDRLNGEKTVVKRDANGRFVKGNGGGPGRPTKREEERYRELLKEAVSYAQWKRIIKKLAGKAERGDVQAMKLLFEYILGKPPQQFQHMGKDGGPIETKDVSEHRAEILGALGSIAAAMGAGEVDSRSE